MRLLIDTHSLLWFCEGNPALSATARAAMEDMTNERYVSHASAWEVAIKLNLGKLSLQTDCGDLFPGVMDANGFVLLNLSLAHYQALIPLPRHHGDPFDRMIIAQAQVEQLTVVTADIHFTAYGIPLLW